MRTLEFRGGDQMPILGLGTWKSDPGEVKKAVMEAVRIGYRHFDCAANYGNEAEVGEALNDCIEEGLVKREELWVTSKLPNDAHKQEDVLPAMTTSLKDLQLDYLDLYLIHWPVALKRGVQFARSADDFVPLEEVPIIETWQAMEELRVEGLARHIGVSNFSQEKLTALIPESRFEPEMNQIELHPYLQQPELVEYCRDNHIHVTAYSPLGSNDRPGAGENDPVLMEDQNLKEIAEKHNCSPAQVLIAFAVERNTAVIPKATSTGHLQSNFDALKISLDREDMERLQKMDKGFRFIDASFFEMENGPYTKESIWDEKVEDMDPKIRKEMV